MNIRSNNTIPNSKKIVILQFYLTLAKKSKEHNRKNSEAQKGKKEEMSTQRMKKIP